MTHAVGGGATLDGNESREKNILQTRIKYSHIDVVYTYSQFLVTYTISCKYPKFSTLFYDYLFTIKSYDYCVFYSSYFVLIACPIKSLPLTL